MTPAIALLTMLWVAPANAQAPLEARFADGPWGARPERAACSPAAVVSALGGSRLQIQRLQNGRHAEGAMVAGSVMRHHDCDSKSGWCTPVAETSEWFSPNLNPAIKDPCVAFCVRVHEWQHFSDHRRWSIRWTSEELSRHWELPAYQAEAACLETFRAPISLDPKLLQSPRF